MVNRGEMTVPRLSYTLVTSMGRETLFYLSLSLECERPLGPKRSTAAFRSRSCSRWAGKRRLFATATCPVWTDEAPVQALMGRGLRRDVLSSARLEQIFRLSTRPDRASTAKGISTGNNLSRIQDVNILPIKWYTAFENAKPRRRIDALSRSCPSNRHRQ